MCEDSRICLTIGKNMTKVLKRLNKGGEQSIVRLWLDFKNDITLRSPVALFHVLSKLQDKRFISINQKIKEVNFLMKNFKNKINENGNIKLKITELGKSLLTIIQEANS